MAKNNRTVSPNPNGGWDVRGAGRRAGAHLDTQRQAINRAGDIVCNLGGGDVTIQGRNGQFREKNTIKPGNDPRSIKG